MPVGTMLREMSSRELTEWQGLVIIEREERLQREADARVKRQLAEVEARAKGVRR